MFDVKPLKKSWHSELISTKWELRLSYSLFSHPTWQGDYPMKALQTGSSFVHLSRRTFRMALTIHDWAYFVSALWNYTWGAVRTFQDHSRRFFQKKNDSFKQIWRICGEMRARIGRKTKADRWHSLWQKQNQTNQLSLVASHLGGSVSTSRGWRTSNVFRRWIHTGEDFCKIRAKAETVEHFI